MNKDYARVDARERGGRLTIGVQVDRDALRVVEINHGHITAWATAPYATGLTPQSPEFPQFLKKALESFEPVRREAHIWVLGCFPSLQVRFLSAPKTRPSQVSNMVYWTFRKEIPFDAALTVFDYDVEGEQVEGASRKIDVTAYAVVQSDLDALSAMFARAGYRLAGVVTPHFAMRNLFRARWLNHEHTTLSLYVGEESSSVQIQSGGHVAFSRVFITGMNAILDVLRERHPERTPAQAFEQLRGSDRDEVSESREIIRPALGRLMQQVERSMAAYLVGRSAEEIKRIHVMGALAALPRLVDEMGAQWGIKTLPVHVIEPPHLAAGVAPPADEQESALLTMAAAVALSNEGRTPNLLHTYVKREKAARARRTRKLVTAISCLALALLLAGHAITMRINGRKMRELEALEERAAQYTPGLDRDMIGRLVAEVQARHTRFRSIARNCRSIAVLNQLATLTPPDIRLASIRISLDPRDVKDRGESADLERVRIEGMVRGLPETQESRLASYVIQVEDDELFEGVSVAKSIPGREGSEPVLLFEMDVRLAAITEEAPAEPMLISKEMP